jgi:hypothetical protein
VKIDKYFIRDISDHPENLQMLQAIKGIADVFGTQLIAEGIETATTCARCATWTSPGPGLAAGPPGHGAARGGGQRSAGGHARPPRGRAAPPGADRAPGHLRSLLVVQAPTAAPATNNDAVAALFRQHTDLHALAVVDGSRPWPSSTASSS